MAWSVNPVRVNASSKDGLKSFLQKKFQKPGSVIAWNLMLTPSSDPEISQSQDKLRKKHARVI